MNKFVDSFIFSLLVSLVMVMLDALYHLASSTAVHINYVAVKFVVIFLVFFLTTYWIGKGWDEGVFSTIAGPIIFYIYYRVADSTLNRELFKIDEGFGYIFLHMAVAVIAYAAVYNFIVRKKAADRLPRNVRVAGAAFAAFILSLLILSFDTAYQLEKVQLITGNEELVARVLSFGLTSYLFFLLFVITFLCHYYIKNTNLRVVIIVLGTVLSTFLLGTDFLRSAVSIISAAVPYYLLHFYSKSVKSV